MLVIFVQQSKINKFCINITVFPDEWNNLQAGYKLGCANAGFPLFLLRSRASVISISWPPWAQHIGPMSDVIKLIFSLYQA